MSRKYAIIDIETTGGLVRRDKIIEFALVLHDGNTIIDQYQTLINPGRSVSRQITMLTGITNEMLVDAPFFYEVARDIVELTQDCVFVAHNVRFDYSFIKMEFERLGYTYTRKQLCTVRLSRMLNPHLKRHGLDALCDAFDIGNADRHRALGDALATATLFQHFVENLSGAEKIEEIINYGIKASRLPVAISIEKLHALPEACGVYYFHNADGKVIYVGKSINIKKRVMQHFAANTAKSNRLQQRVDDISFEETGSELLALLLEEREIKRLQPEVNRSLRKKLFPFALYYFEDEEGYLQIRAEKIKKQTPAGYSIIKEYPKLAYAKGHLEGMIEHFNLCQHKCGDKTGVGACFHYGIGVCPGACKGDEVPQEYNARVRDAIDYLQRTVEDSFFILDRGRTAEEHAVVLVEEGQVRGYGYIHSESYTYDNVHALKEALQPLQGSRDAQRIVHWYLKEEKMQKVIPL